MPQASTIQQELISTDVQEIISYKPHWFIRKGNMIFFLVFAALLAGTWFISYPDIVKGSARIVAIDGPKMVNTKTEGIIKKLLVANEATVKENQPLAYMQSLGRHQEVMDLKQWIESVEVPVRADSLELILKFPLATFAQLGELQQDYELFYIQYKETQQLLSSGFYQQKKKALLTDIGYIASLKNNLQKQNNLLQQEYAVQQKDYSAKEYLTNEKVIAPLELNQEKGKMLLKEQGLEQMNNQIINSNIALHNKQKELLELQKFVSDQKIKFLSALLTLKAKTAEWMRKYVVTAPQGGKLYYTSFFTENQLVPVNTDLFYVQPETSIYYAELKAGQDGIGKISNHQNVLLRLQGYPSEQFGYLKGSVSYISNMPSRNDSFIVKVALPRGLVTNQNKKVYFRNNLLATGEIITSNRKLFDRFVGRLYEILKRN
ncbi:MAG: HlyD family secretion protein [Chitinophagaceae bacterium]|nr:HlyD family secretion protein [Chitinophagaceae bacterium]